jgi:hypothetical protein
MRFSVNVRSRRKQTNLRLCLISTINTPRARARTCIKGQPCSNSLYIRGKSSHNAWRAMCASDILMHINNQPRAMPHDIERTAAKIMLFVLFMRSAVCSLVASPISDDTIGAKKIFLRMYYMRVDLVKMLSHLYFD